MRLHVLADDKPLANDANPAILDEQVGLIIVHSRDNATVLDQDCCHRLPLRIGCRTIVSPVCDTLPLLQMPAQVGLSHTGLCSARISYDRRAWLLPAPLCQRGEGTRRTENCMTLGAYMLLDREGSRVYA